MLQSPFDPTSNLANFCQCSTLLEANRILNGEYDADDGDADDNEGNDNGAANDGEDDEEEKSAVKERRVREGREARLKKERKKWRLSPCGGGCLACGCSRVTLVEREAQVRRAVET